MIASATSNGLSKPLRYSNGTQFRMRSCFVIMATGTGKTPVQATLGKRIAERTGKRVFYFVDTDELVANMEGALDLVGISDVGIEKASRTLKGARHQPQHVIGSIQTLWNRRRLEHFDPHDFAQLVSDEGDKAVAPGWRGVLGYFDVNPQIVHVGFSASYERMDNVSLGSVYQKIAYELHAGPWTDRESGEIRPGAIDLGWLVPIVTKSMTVLGADFSKVDRTAGDMSDAQIEEVISNERTVQADVDSIMQAVERRKAIVFTAGRKQGSAYTEQFRRRREGSAEWVDGETPLDVRRSIFRRFASGEIQYLVNHGVATRGVDVPDCEVAVIRRPTKSIELFKQMVGRPARPLRGVLDPYIFGTPEERKAAIAASAKPYALILDMVDNSGRHQFVSCVDLLGGIYPEPVLAVAREMLKEGGSVDMASIFARSQEEHERREAERIAKEAEEAKRRDKLRHVVGEGIYRTEDVDLFGGEKYRPPEKKHDPSKPTPAMVEQMKKLGIDEGEYRGLSRGQAAILYRVWADRRSAGLCSKRQCAVLWGAGIDPTSVTRAEAKKLIDTLAANNWRMPA